MVCSSGRDGLVRCSISTISFDTVYDFRVGSTLLVPCVTSLRLTPVRITRQVVYFRVAGSYFYMVGCLFGFAVQTTGDGLFYDGAFSFFVFVVSSFFFLLCSFSVGL